MRVVKDPEVLEAMCKRLGQLIAHLYGGDMSLVATLMRYQTDSTLRRALNNKNSFPDVERLHFLSLSSSKRGVMPNMNWLLNGVENPLIKIEKGKAAGQLTFGQYLDKKMQAR